MESHEIVLGVTGSIGAYKAADLVRRLKERGCGVTCVMTHEACQFITPLTLEALSERPVYTELFRRNDPPFAPPPVAAPKAHHPADGGATGGGVIHTTLADHARLVLIAPATANVLGKLSHGLADDLLSCLVLATTAPVLIAPAMNVHMYRHPTVQQNIARLKALGCHFVGPDVGRLACGYEAVGHLADVEEIVRAALDLLARSPHPADGGARRHAVHQNPPHKTARRHRPSNGA